MIEDDGEEWRSTGTAEVMVFRPTMEEFRDFPGYIEKIERQGAHLKCGIVKVIPPAEWHPRPSRKGDYSDVDSFVLQSPVKERFVGQSGCYTKYNTVYKKSLTVGEYKQLANNPKYLPPSINLKDLERHYWRNLLFHEPIYGADTPGSIYDEGIKEWNINRLGTILDLLGDECNVEIQGVNTAYLYFGMWKTTFPWHVEDMDLYSINYLHYGAPKFWYGIPATAADRFEGLASQFFSQSSAECKAFLRHKMHLVSPFLLKSHNIHFGTMVQRAGEFMITFPRGYHAGFNTGYNCAESTNFASQRWIDYGKKAILCTCRDDTVRVDMTPFMRKYRPDEFDAWHQYWYGERLPQPTKSCRSKRHPISHDKNGRKTNKSASSASEKRRKRDKSESGDSSLEQLAASTSQLSEDWSQPLEKLWIWRFADFEAEREFNRSMALEEPHCAVCQYFVPRSLCKKADRIPKYSRRLVSNLCFSKDPAKAVIQAEEKEDRLISCRTCCITVHVSCYGVGAVSDSWECARCQDAARVYVECRLCCLRGGPLVPVEQYGWVHVICAIFHRKAVFVDPSSKKTVKIEFEDKGDDAPYQCNYCKSDAGALVTCASCLPADALVFHPTCGRLAGVSYEFRDWPVLVAVVCPNHTTGPDEEHDLPPIKIGERVIVWLEEGTKVQRGVVESKKSETFCVVDFDDGSISNDLYPQDISYCECSASGCKGNHVSGAKVRISWTDGLVYGGVFRRSTTAMIYKVKLKDENTSVEVFRDEVYGPNEVIPDTVLERLNETK
uniref:[histone H3]-trimethyl-L-lysine(9) demethylase n=1 Tax=Plectus sambesii TaxID=2011161 RepID=A0A914VIX2_9BILA